MPLLARKGTSLPVETKPMPYSIPLSEEIGDGRSGRRHSAFTASSMALVASS